MLNQKKIPKKIIIIVIFSIILISILLLYLSNNTVLFKSEEQIKDDLITIQQEISNDKEQEKYTEIENSLYSKDVGVSKGTLYIKDNAENKIKESVKSTKIGYEKTIKSENGMIVIDPYVGTGITGYKIISNTKDNIEITYYTYQNLCDNIFFVNDFKDIKEIEEGTDNLPKTIIAPNTTYTLTNSIGQNNNIVFFLDSDSKYINKTTKKTFTTPENARYIKIITEGVDKTIEAVKYNLSLGEKEGVGFDAYSMITHVNSDGKTPLDLEFITEKSVLYIDGGEIELSYVSK